jgi:hypothetical protein
MERRTQQKNKSKPDAAPPRPSPERSVTALKAAALRREFRSWRASLSTALERDTLLMPEAIADSVVAEAGCFLNTDLPDDFAERLTAKAYWLYPRHAHFRRALGRSGNAGRDSLYMYMRHWVSAWLKRERRVLFKRLPRSYLLGQRLP